MVCLFAIRYLGLGVNGKHWFLAKEKYLVCLAPGERSCDCRHGTMQISRGKKSDCKHVKKARELLKVMRKS